MTRIVDPALIVLMNASLALIAHYEWLTEQKAKVAA